MRPVRGEFIREVPGAEQNSNSPRGTMAYLCLQVTREGVASFAHVHGIVSGLERRGWRVTLFEPTYSRNDGSAGVFERLWQFALVQMRLWKQRDKFDLIYLRTHFGAFPMCLAARVAGIPVVHEVNGPHEDLFIAWPGTEWLAPLIRVMRRLELKWADAVIAVTSGLAAWALNETDRDSETVHCVTNGADTHHFAPDRTCDVALPRRYVSFVGALTRWQGIETMLRAIETDIWPEDVPLVIAGDGSEASTVCEAAVDNNRLMYLGPIPYDEVPGMVSGSIAGLSPQNNVRGRSDTGLYPLKVFEALACGVPVVVSDFPGQGDLVRQNDCGLIVPPEQPVALAKAVRWLHEHSEERERMGENGRREVVTHHSWDRKAGETADILSKVLLKRYSDADG